MVFGEDFGSDAISLEVPVKSVIEYSYRKGDGTSGCEQIHGWWESQDGGCGLRGFFVCEKRVYRRLRRFAEWYAEGAASAAHESRLGKCARCGAEEPCTKV